MQDVPHDGFMRHLGVVTVGVVDGIVLTFTNIRRERLVVIGDR